MWHTPEFKFLTIRGTGYDYPSSITKTLIFQVDCRPMIHTTQARWSIFIVLVVLLCFSVIYSGLLEGVQSGSKNAWFEGLNGGPARCSVSTHEEAAVDPWDPSLVLNGLPTPKFKGVSNSHFSKVLPNLFPTDNLRNDTWYVTAWSNAGFSTSNNFALVSFLTAYASSKPIHELCTSKKILSLFLALILGSGQHDLPGKSFGASTYHSSLRT